VDDWKILLPRGLLSHFQYIEPDYSYLVYEESDYGMSLDRVLHLKGRQTFLFAILIEEMLVMEKRTWPKVFERLKAEGVKLYQSSTPTETISREIKSVKRAIRSDADLSFLDAEAERRARAVIRAQVEELFLPCKEFRIKHYGSW